MTGRMAGCVLLQIPSLDYGQILMLSVPLHEPVKFDPPPPLAPPITNFSHGVLVLFTPSGVPAWSPLLCPHAVWWPALI
jgi:hypothetical protein